jgi:hypothetical protein
MNNGDLKRRSFINFKRGYEDGSIISHHRHMHSVLGATSLAFFLSLFSAGDLTSTKGLLMSSEVLFAFALISNVHLSFLYQASNDREFTWNIDGTWPMMLYRTLALYIPVIAILLLIAHHYIPAAVLALITCFLGLIVFKCSVKLSIINGAKRSKYRMKLIMDDNFDEYDKLRFMDFIHRYSESELINNSYKYRVVVKNEASSNDISLHHQVTIGDIVQLSETERCTVLHIVHSKKSTSLICDEIVKCEYYHN